MKMPFLVHSPWCCYSRRAEQRILRPRYGGVILEAEAEARLLHLAVGEAASEDGSERVRFYWLVDREEGRIVEARYQLIGGPALIAGAEAAGELLPKKNYDQARRFVPALLAHHWNDPKEGAGLPQSADAALWLVVRALGAAAEQCSMLPLSTSYTSPPIGQSLPEQEAVADLHPEWESLSLKEQVVLIEEILDRDVRPYIALDGGGIVVLGLEGHYRLTIAYQGNCTSCFSAVGATLSYIQTTLQEKVHPRLQVIPEL